MSDPRNPDPAKALRLYVGPAQPLSAGLEFDLPDAALRHAQVRRVQPGDTLALFDGSGPDWPALVLSMGRSSLRVRLAGTALVQTRSAELPQPWTLALVMPANERMDALVEKATELGAARVVPLMSERSVLRLQGERAARRQAHWQGVAVAACEQCGRSVVPEVAEVQALLPWLQGLGAGEGAARPLSLRWLLSLRSGTLPLALVANGALMPASADGRQAAATVTLLSGPEGGFSADEEAAALRQGFVLVSLGPRVLRADTAPLAALAWWGLQSALA